MIEKKYAPLWKFIIFAVLYMPINFVYYAVYKIPRLKGPKLEYYKNYLKGLKEGYSN